MKKFLIILIVLAGGIYYVWLGISNPLDSGSDVEKLFRIEKGEGIEEVSSKLEETHLIKNKSLFRIYVVFSGNTRRLKAGSYLLSPSMSIIQIVDKIVSGETVEESLTFIEGWKIKDIAWYLENKGLFQAEELFEIVGYPTVDYLEEGMPAPKNFSDEYDFLKDKPRKMSLEGYLFPDTYYIGSDDNLEDIVLMTLDNFDKKLNNKIREDIKNQGKSIFEIITMASLIEKEVRTLEDKKIVSGVLWKRMENGVPLQVDATIAYITDKKTTKISIEETKIDSPYNTYKYTGLPLGPISNPGLESILASVYPESSEYWYYLSTPEGETIFSRNLEEHNIAKAKYLK